VMVQLRLELVNERHLHYQLHNFLNGTEGVLDCGMRNSSSVCDTLAITLGAFSHVQTLGLGFALVPTTLLFTMFWDCLVAAQNKFLIFCSCFFNNRKRDSTRTFVDAGIFSIMDCFKYKLTVFYSKLALLH